MTSGRWVLRRVARRLRRDWRGVAWQAAAFAGIAALGAAAHTLFQQSGAGAAVLAEEAHLVAYLDDDLPADRAEALLTGLGRLPSVVQVRQIDGQRALGELARQLGRMNGQENKPTPGAASALADLEGGFLPSSLELQLAAGPDLRGRVDDLAARLRRLPGVTAVDALTDGMERLAAFQALARRLALLFASAAITAAVILSGALVARERRRRLDEAQALLLVGLPPASAWIPACVVAALAAVTGGALGLGLGRLGGATLFDPGQGLPPAPLSVWLIALGAMLAVGLLVGRLAIPAARMPHAH